MTVLQPYASTIIFKVLLVASPLIFGVGLYLLLKSKSKKIGWTLIIISIIIWLILLAYMLGLIPIWWILDFNP